MENSSNNEGNKNLEEKSKTRNKKGKISRFVDLVIEHPIWSTIIGVSSVALEEVIRRKLHSKQETALVIYKPKFNKSANEYVRSIFDSSLRHYVKEFLDDKLVKNEILEEFFGIVFSLDSFAYARQELKKDKKRYYLKRKLALGTSIIPKRYKKLRSSIEFLEGIGATFKFVTYMKEDKFGIFYLCVDVIVGEKKMMTEEICYFNV